MATKPTYTDEDRASVIHLFKTLKNNSIQNIVKKTGFGKTFINKTIDNEYKKRFQNKLRSKKVEHAKQRT